VGGTRLIGSSGGKVGKKCFALLDWRFMWGTAAGDASPARLSQHCYLFEAMISTKKVGAHGGTPSTCLTGGKTGGADCHEGDPCGRWVRGAGTRLRFPAGPQCRPVRVCGYRGEQTGTWRLTGFCPPGISKNRKRGGPLKPPCRPGMGDEGLCVSPTEGGWAEKRDGFFRRIFPGRCFPPGASGYFDVSFAGGTKESLKGPRELFLGLVLLWTGRRARARPRFHGPQRRDTKHRASLQPNPHPPPSCTRHPPTAAPRSTPHILSFPGTPAAWPPAPPPTPPPPPPPPSPSHPPHHPPHTPHPPGGPPTPTNFSFLGGGGKPGGGAIFGGPRRAFTPGENKKRITRRGRAGDPPRAWDPKPVQTTRRAATNCSWGSGGGKKRRQQGIKSRGHGG